MSFKLGIGLGILGHGAGDGSVKLRTDTGRAFELLLGDLTGASRGMENRLR
jgi:hypothetical protein